VIVAVDIKISVIVPVYNVGKYLRECLDSVIGQTIHNIEIICVDDGSTDNSLLILKEYETLDERIKIVEQTNQGAGTARNAGMTLAKGEYLAFMDADDVYYPEALQCAYDFISKTEADMLMFNAVYFDEHSEWKNSQLNSALIGGRQTVSAKNDRDFLFQLASCNTWCKLYRREFVQRFGLQYQEIKTANDLCFVCSAMAGARKIAVLDKPLVKHRVLYSGNLQSVKAKTPLDFLSALLMLKQNLQRFGLWDQLRQSYLNCVLTHCAFNWQTLDEPGKKRIAAKKQTIIELLELFEHTENYYYNRNDYELMCEVVGFNRKGDVMFMGKLKEMLKHILPPPVKAFNREINGLRQYMRELNSGLLAQQQQMNEQYQEQIALLCEENNRQNMRYLAVQRDLAEQKKLLAQYKQDNDELIAELANKIAADLQSLNVEFNTKLQAGQDIITKEIKDLNKPVKRDYAYYEDLFTNKYEKELKIWYKAKTGEDLNLQNPKTFNEKIQWLKLYDSTPLKTRLADKYLVREWVAEKIGAEYLIPLLGVWDSFDEIDFDKLPERFVLKANHGFNWNYIVKDKSIFDKKVAKAKFDEWLNTNFAFKGLELHYMNIPPKIIAEKYIADLDGDIFDYRFFCFDGTPKYLWLDIGSGTSHHKRNIYDLDWNLQNYKVSYPNMEENPEKPETFEEMLRLVNVLCQSFALVRVDLYSVSGKVYFGEMTFTPQNGFGKFDDIKQNRIYGDLIKLPPKSPIPMKI